jgi:phosphocarrier protein FPr
MRSEFLFLQRGEPPSEQEQYKAYRQMIEALGGLPLVLRTLDVGGDKSVPYIEMPHEANPFLGLRGIRLCLRNVELFRTQLRAACRASVHGPLKVMFPMIATVEEARSAMAIAEDISYHLGVPQIEMGCMIEVPSAVAMAAELASTMDFFSIGTNDLTQYALAMDRGNPLFAEHAAALHPAVLRMIDQVLRAAEAKGKPVSVCGGWAADPIGCQILVGLGVAELSMPPATIPEIKARIRSASMTALQESARQALRCEDAEEVRTLFGSAMSKK